MRGPTHVRLLDASRTEPPEPIDRLAYEVRLAASLRPGDLILCTAGEVIPADATVVDGSGTLIGRCVVAGWLVLRIAG